MATGDIKNNLQKLLAELKIIKYEKDVDLQRYVIDTLQFLHWVISSPGVSVGAGDHWC